MKRRRKRKGRPRIATKVLEGALVERAKELRDDPELLFPRCEDHEDHYYKFKVRFERIARYSENERKLKALSKWGDQMSRAFATSLSIALKGEVPYLATLNVRGRDVSFVFNTKVRKEILLGVQHYSDPDLRILAFAHIAKSKRLFLYAMREDFVCTGREDNPPRKYVSEALGLTKYPLKREEDTYLCAHCGKKGVSHLVISWIEPGIKIGICESCAKGGNTYHTLTRRFISYDPRRSFGFQVRPNFICDEGEECVLNEKTSLSQTLIAQYVAGGISDSELIEEHMDSIRTHIPHSAERVLALGNRCYGSDTEAFIDALSPSKIERKALELLLEEMDDSLVVESATPNKILMTYWDLYGVDVLDSIVGDRDLAQKVFDRGLRKKDTPAKVLKVALSKAKKEAIESSLPKYKRLPPIAAFADRVSRAFKTEGKASAIREVEKESSQDTKIRSVKYAFMQALGSAEGKDWQFTKEQLDFGRFLKDHAQKLMESEGDDYHDSLQDLLRASGSTQEI
ncbi:MAG: hypothetical protein ACE5IO_05000 [Thermoplasmata archaeon]